MRQTAAATVLLLLLALAGCGIRPEREPQRLPSPGVTAPSPSPSPTDGRQVVVYLLDADGRLRGLPLGAPPGPYESVALAALLEIGAAAPPPGGLQTVVPRGTTLGRVVVYPAEVLVDLGAPFLGLSGPDQVRATAQVVFTATERRPGSRVRLSVDGRTLPVPAGDGSLRTDAVGRLDYALLAPRSPTPTPGTSPGASTPATG